MVLSSIKMSQFTQYPLARKRLTVKKEREGWKVKTHDSITTCKRKDEFEEWRYSLETRDMSLSGRGLLNTVGYSPKEMKVYDVWDCYSAIVESHFLKFMRYSSSWSLRCLLTVATRYYLARKVALKWREFVQRQKIRRVSKYYYKWITISCKPPHGRLFLLDQNWACENGLVTS